MKSMTTIVRPTKAQVATAVEEAGRGKPWTDDQIAADVAGDPDAAPILDADDLRAAGRFGCQPS